MTPADTFKHVLATVAACAVFLLFAWGVYVVGDAFLGWHGPYSSFEATPSDHGKAPLLTPHQLGKIKCFTIEYVEDHPHVTDYTTVGTFCRKDKP